MMCYTIFILLGQKGYYASVWTFMLVHIDIIGPLTETPNGNKYILSVVDSFTDWIECIPMKNQQAYTVVKLFYRNFYWRYGSQFLIISDQGSNVMSHLVQALCELFNVKRHRTTAFHAMSKGRVEVMNSNISKCLRAYCLDQQEDWDIHLLMGLRMSCNSSSQYSLYQNALWSSHATPDLSCLTSKILHF